MAEKNKLIKYLLLNSYKYVYKTKQNKKKIIKKTVCNKNFYRIIIKRK